MQFENVITKSANRRSFLKSWAFAAGAATMSAGLLRRALPAFSSEEKSGPNDHYQLLQYAYLLAISSLSNCYTNCYTNYKGHFYRLKQPKPIRNSPVGTSS